jgi:hypothetical protein
MGADGRELGEGLRFTTKHTKHTKRGTGVGAAE